MNSFKFLSTIILALVATNCLASDEKQTPTDAFRGQTQYYQLMCQLEEKITVQKIKLGQNPDGGGIGLCIKKGRTEAKKAFGPALQAVAKNKEATKLIKDYYAAWLTSLDGLIPGAGETEQDYNRRQNETQANYDAIWNRFEVEAGL